MTALLPPVIGLGGATGYAPGDLTAAAAAAARGELPCLPVGTAASGVGVVELRVHGVGGAPAEVNLETPGALQVAGDAAAGFHRSWFPGRGDQRDPRAWPTVGGVPARREAYCWGRLNTASWSRALWLLLVAFALTNLAHWALPSAARGGLAYAGRAVVRLAALTMTAATVQTASFLLVDVLARQALSRGLTPAWLDGVADVAVPVRQGVALAVVVLGVAVLLGLSRSTGRDYERWPAPPVTPDPAAPAALRREAIWSGARTLGRQRIAHATVAVGAVALTASSFDGLPAGVRWTLRAWAVVPAVVAVVLTVLPWVDRLASPTAIGPVAGWARSRIGPVLALAAAVVPLVLATASATAPTGPLGALPGDLGTQEVLVAVLLGWCVVLAVLVASTRPRHRAAFLRGHAASALLLFGAMVAAVFAAAVTQVVANLLGTPVGTGSGATAGTVQSLRLPVTVYAGGFAFAVTLVALAVAVGCVAVGRAARSRRLLGGVPRRPGEVGVDDLYDPAAVAAGRGEARRVAGAWATAAVTDSAGRVLGAVSVAAALAFVGYAVLARADTLPRWADTVAAYGGSAAAAVTLAFVVVLRQSIVSAAGRKRFGLLWDVVTFWPRAAHPLAPPCYAERSVPELVTRIRRLVGDVERGDPADPAVPPDLAVAAQRTERAGAVPAWATPEATTPLLLVGYSQGTPISVATVALLPDPVRDRVALLTLAAPVHRLYGRAFPAWFGPAELDAVAASLGDGTRWRNLVRASDYIGGWVRSPWPGMPGGVDRWILDPPVLAVDHDPAPPPVHRHSSWFPDPQTRPAADDLVRTLLTPTAG